MINEDKLVVYWLRSVLSTNRVWTGDLPKGFKPSEGPGVVISVRQGLADPDTPLVKSSIQVKCWSVRNGYQTSRDTYGSIFDQMHGRNNLDFGAFGYVMYCIEQQRPQDITDPDTGWATTVGFFEIETRDSAADSISVNGIDLGFIIQVNGVDV